MLLLDDVPQCHRVIAVTMAVVVHIIVTINQLKLSRKHTVRHKLYISGNHIIFVERARNYPKVIFNDNNASQQMHQYIPKIDNTTVLFDETRNSLNEAALIILTQRSINFIDTKFLKA